MEHGSKLTCLAPDLVLEDLSNLRARRQVVEVRTMHLLRCLGRRPDVACRGVWISRGTNSYIAIVLPCSALLSHTGIAGAVQGFNPGFMSMFVVAVHVDFWQVLWSDSIDDPHKRITGKFYRLPSYYLIGRLGRSLG